MQTLLCLLVALLVALSGPALGQELSLQDRQALLDLYGGFTDKGSLVWNTTEELCGQTGITCNKENPMRVTSLALFPSGISGTLSTSYTSLSKLDFLLIQGNDLTGSIPTQIALLKDLQILSLDGNRLSGTIPTFIAYLSRLEVLSTKNNQMSGPIPSEIIYLTSLSSLNLANNSFSGTIPTQLGSLKQLAEIILEDNQFTGTIPSSLSDLPLTKLVLAGNLVEGTVPSSFGNSPIMQELRLVGNRFQCPVTDYKNPPLNDYSDYKTDCEYACGFTEANKPCKNGGICIARPNFDYECICTPDFSGEDCTSGGSLTLASWPLLSAASLALSLLLLLPPSRA